MKTKKQYLLVDTKQHRRHSAPENLGGWCAPHQSHLFKLENEDWCRASVSDFSVLVENQSESGSSQELDTSNLSRDLSPAPTVKSSPKDSYENISISELERSRTVEERNPLVSWFMWKNILMSQIIAACLTIMETSSSSIRKNSQNMIINGQTTQERRKYQASTGLELSGQNLPHYILLGFLWTTKLVMRNEGRDIVETIKYSGFRYFFLSILHVEANYLLCLSFHHKTYLGNQMIDCVAASLSFLIAYVCLEIRFQCVHIFGFLFTNMGAIGLCAANIIHQDQSEDDVVLGDLLRMACGICLGLNSIAQEIIVTSIDFVEYLGMIGLIGSMVCGFQTVALETNIHAPKHTIYWADVLSYSVSQLFLNSLAPIVLRDMGATGLHLALISSGFYSYFIRLLLEQQQVHILYLLSFTAAVIGSFLFTNKRTSAGTKFFYPVKVNLSKGR